MKEVRLVEIDATVFEQIEGFVEDELAIVIYYQM